MKQFKLISIIVFLILTLGIVGATMQGPINMMPGANITGTTTSFAHNFANGSGQDLATFNQLVKVGSNKGWATVGPGYQNDYVTSGTNDGPIIWNAFAAGNRVVLLTGICYIAAGHPASFSADGQTLIGTGWGPQSELSLLTSGSLFVINHSRVQISDIYFYGNRLDHPAGDYGIDWSAGDEVTLDLIQFGNIGYDAIYDHTGTSNMGSTISRCFMHCFRSGISIGPGVGDLRIDNNEIGNCSKYTINCSGANIQISNNHLWSVLSAGSFSPLIELNPGSSLGGDVITDNFLEGIRWAAIDIGRGANNNTISANHFWNPLLHDYSVNWIVVNSSTNTISSNVFDDNAGYITNAIKIVASVCKYNKIGFNTLDGDGILDFGTSTIFGTAGTNPGSNI